MTIFNSFSDAIKNGFVKIKNKRTKIWFNEDREEQRSLYQTKITKFKNEQEIWDHEIIDSFFLFDKRFEFNPSDWSGYQFAYKMGAGPLKIEKISEKIIKWSPKKIKFEKLVQEREVTQKLIDKYDNLGYEVLNLRDLENQLKKRYSTLDSFSYKEKEKIEADLKKINDIK